MNPCLRSKIVPLLVLMPGLALSQNDPVNMSRQRPDTNQAAAATPPTPTLPLKEDFAKAAKLVRARTKKGSAAGSSTLLLGNITAVPGDKPVILPENAIEAIRLESNWRNTDATPMLDSGGRISYIYGHGQPNIPCAPNKVCTIEFEPGEILDASGIEIGDPERWKFARHQVLVNGQPLAFITVSPKFAGSDTPLTVFTDKRVYYLRLLADTTGYVERVGFQYPVDPLEKRKQEQADQEAKTAEAKREADRKAELKAANTISPISNTDYTVRIGKHAEYLRPLLLGDNGAHTFIRLAEVARNRDKPEVRVLNFTGPDTPNVHYDPKDMTFTVDGLFRQAEVSSGVGKRRLIVKIFNNRKFGA